MLSFLSRARIRDERGVSMVMFAVVLPVIVLISVLSVDVGNWFVHKKRAQTMADAGAFAGGGSFTGCGQDMVATNLAIEQVALNYAGDRNRDVNTRNVQEQEASPGDVHVVLNSTNYWAENDPLNGAGHDYTYASPDGHPCETRALDVKATDHKVPLLFGFIPVAADVHGHARVEIRQVLDVTGLLPFAVPEVSPNKVAAVIVNEDVPQNNANSVVGAAWLNNNTPAFPTGLSQWNVWHGDLAGVNVNGNENFNTVIVVSRDPSASLTGSLQTICNQNPVQVTCYGKPYSSTSGLSFIHSYSDASGGGADPPAVRQVELFGGCGTDLSSPYFNLNGGCSIVIQAKLDFGVGGDPTAPNRPCAEVTGPGGPMTWSAGGIGGPLGTWTGSFTPGVASGRNVINLSYRTDRAGPCGAGPDDTGSLPRVAAPYVSNTNSGPVQYLWVQNNNSPFGPANSINGTSSASLHVTVGLLPQLDDADPLDPPIALRYASDPGSQNQAVDCDKNVNFRDEILNGCLNPYRENLRNGSCAGYGSGNLPRPPVAPLPGDDCIITETGDKTGQIRQAMEDRWGGNPCKTKNNWPKNAGDPLPPSSDPRYVTLFITDENSFGGSGNDIYPIRRFAGFYITSADGLNCDFPGTQFDDDPANPGPKNVWGHFVTYVVPNPQGTASDELCAFNDAGLCIAVLTE